MHDVTSRFAMSGVIVLSETIQLRERNAAFDTAVPPAHGDSGSIAAIASRQSAWMRLSIRALRPLGMPFRRLVRADAWSGVDGIG
jgi:hypothetical protein